MQRPNVVTHDGYKIALSRVIRKGGEYAPTAQKLLTRHNVLSNQVERSAYNIDADTYLEKLARFEAKMDTVVPALEVLSA